MAQQPSAFRQPQILAWVLLGACLFAAPTFAETPTPPSGYSCLVPTEKGTPLAGFYEAQQVFFMWEGLGMDLVFMPGRGGAYVWGRIDSLPKNGRSLAGVILPDYILQTRLPEPFHRLDSARIFAVSARMPMALWVAKDSPCETVADFVSLVRSQGGTYTAAGDGSLTGAHLACLIFDRASGIRSSYLPMLSEKAAMEAVVQGKALAWWGRAVLPAGPADRLKPLAVAAEERKAHLPGVATFREQDLDVVLYSYACLAVPNGTSRELEESLHALSVKMARNTSWRETVSMIGWEPLGHKAEYALGELDGFLRTETGRTLEAGREYGLIPPERDSP